MSEKYFHKYRDLDHKRYLQYGGRELIGKFLVSTEKKDGECVPIWLNERQERKIGSRNQSIASGDITNRMMTTPEWELVQQLLLDEYLTYSKRYVVYGELDKEISPTRIEMRKKHLHWTMFDIYDLKAERYLGYSAVYQKAYDYGIPVVRLVDDLWLETLEELDEFCDSGIEWAKRHHREGVVIKCYENQVFFKVKRNLPKHKSTKTKGEIKPMLPPMPDDKCFRALVNAFIEVGEDDWDDVRIAMPVVANHFSTEAREHYYSVPKNIFLWYKDIPVEDLKDGEFRGRKGQVL